MDIAQLKIDKTLKMRFTKDNICPLPNYNLLCVCVEEELNVE